MGSFRLERACLFPASTTRARDNKPPDTHAVVASDLDTERRMIGLSVNSDLEWIWKDVAIAVFKVLFQN